MLEGIAAVVGAIVLALIKGLTYATKESVEVKSSVGEPLGPRLSARLRDLAKD